MKSIDRIALFILFCFLPLIGTSQEFRWVINPHYEEVSKFSDTQLAAAKLFFNDWGFITRQGEFVIKPQFKKSASFSEGLAAVKQQNIWGFIDNQGNMKIKPQFKKVNSFSEGLAGVFKENWGFIDKTGCYVFDGRFENVGSFKEGLAAARINGKWGFIDTNGDWVIKPLFKEVSEFSEGLAGACMNEQWGIIDRIGNWVVKPKYQEIGVFNERLVAAKLNNKWGYIDKTGSDRIPFNYDGTTNFSSGLAAVCQKKQWGYIDKLGSWIIQPQFDMAFCFDEKTRIAEVKVGSLWGFIEIDNISQFVKKEVENNLNEWQHKGEFEKTSEYLERVNERTRNDKIQELTTKAINDYKISYANSINWKELQLGNYDADNETYLIKSAILGDFVVPVPKGDAVSFKQNWAGMNFYQVDFNVENEQLILAKLTISDAIKEKSYYYDRNEFFEYRANGNTFTFEPVEVNIPEKGIINNVSIESVHDSKIENTQLQLQGDKLIITFDVIGSRNLDNVWLDITTTSNKKIRPRAISGDIGKSIFAGTNRCIIWDMKADGVDLQGEELNVKVLALKPNDSINSLTEITEVETGRQNKNRDKIVFNNGNKLNGRLDQRFARFNSKFSALDGNSFSVVFDDIKVIQSNNLNKDSIFLKNGDVVYGSITAIYPNDQITLRSRTNAKYSIQISEIETVRTSCNSSTLYGKRYFGMFFLRGVESYGPTLGLKIGVLNDWGYHAQLGVGQEIVHYGIGGTRYLFSKGGIDFHAALGIFDVVEKHAYEANEHFFGFDIGFFGQVGHFVFNFGAGPKNISLGLGYSIRSK